MSEIDNRNRFLSLYESGITLVQSLCFPPAISRLTVEIGCL